MERKRKEKRKIGIFLAGGITAVGIFVGGYFIGKASNKATIKILQDENQNLIKRLERSKYHLGELFEKLKGG